MQPYHWPAAKRPFLDKLQQQKQFEQSFSESNTKYGIHAKGNGSKIIKESCPQSRLVSLTIALDW